MCPAKADAPDSERHAVSGSEGAPVTTHTSRSSSSAISTPATDRRAPAIRRRSSPSSGSPRTNSIAFTQTCQPSVTLTSSGDAETPRTSGSSVTRLHSFTSRPSLALYPGHRPHTGRSAPSGSRNTGHAGTVPVGHPGNVPTSCGNRAAPLRSVSCLPGAKRLPHGGQISVRREKAPPRVTVPPGGQRRPGSSRVVAVPREAFSWRWPRSAAALGTAAPETAVQQRISAGR